MKGARPSLSPLCRLSAAGKKPPVIVAAIAREMAASVGHWQGGRRQFPSWRFCRQFLRRDNEAASAYCLTLECSRPTEDCPLPHDNVPTTGIRILRLAADGQAQRVAQVLEKMPVVGHLRCIGSTATGALSKTPARSRGDLDARIVFQPDVKGVGLNFSGRPTPRCDRVGISIRQQIEDAVALQIADDLSVTRCPLRQAQSSMVVPGGGFRQAAETWTARVHRLRRGHENHPVGLRENEQSTARAKSTSGRHGARANRGVDCDADYELIRTVRKSRTK